MAKRVITGVVFTFAIVAGILLQGWFLRLMLLFAMLLSLSEMYRAFRNIGANVAVVPEKIDGRPVVKIGQGAFANWGFLKLVALPSSVKEIGWQAFANCNALKSVEIPASVREIGDEAFADCASDLTLYGAAGSVAEKYAAENGLSFKPLEAR